MLMDKNKTKTIKKSKSKLQLKTKFNDKDVKLLKINGKQTHQIKINLKDKKDMNNQNKMQKANQLNQIQQNQIYQQQSSQFHNQQQPKFYQIEEMRQPIYSKAIQMMLRCPVCNEDYNKKLKMPLILCKNLHKICLQCFNKKNQKCTISPKIKLICYLCSDKIQNIRFSCDVHNLVQQISQNNLQIQTQNSTSQQLTSARQINFNQKINIIEIKMQKIIQIRDTKRQFSILGLKKHEQVSQPLKSYTLARLYPQIDLVYNIPIKFGVNLIKFQLGQTKQYDFHYLCFRFMSQYSRQKKQLKANSQLTITDHLDFSYKIPGYNISQLYYIRARRIQMIIDLFSKKQNILIKDQWNNVLKQQQIQLKYSISQYFQNTYQPIYLCLTLINKDFQYIK